MDLRLLHLIATVIDACDQPPIRGPGHPPSETIRVVATLRRFLREGTPWRSLSATPSQASGATLRRCLARWASGVCWQKYMPCWSVCCAAIPT